MTNLKQTNFEKLKTIIYQHIVVNGDFDFSLLGSPFVATQLKRESAKKHINDLLDSMDIRAIGNLPIEIIEKFPNWYKKNNYCIDYNKNGFLDFIKH